MKFTLRAQINRALQDGARAVVAKLEQIQSRGAEPVWLGTVARFEAAQAQQTWASEGAKSGKAWPDLRQGVGNMDAYAKWKQRNWPGRKLNVWRGDTRDSFTQVGNPDHIARTSGKFLEFGSKAKLASKMHLGEKAGSWKFAYLKEKSPVKTFRNGKVRTRNWFTLRYKEIPARPLARKSIAQERELKLALGKALTSELSRASGGSSNAFSRGLARVAGRMRPDPRA